MTLEEAKAQANKVLDEIEPILVKLRADMACAGFTLVIETKKDGLFDFGLTPTRKQSREREPME